MTVRPTVHIVKRNDPLAMDLICRQSEKNPVTVILIQEAARESVRLTFPSHAVSVFVLQDDTPEDARYPRIDYPKVLDMIFSADRVMVW